MVFEQLNIIEKLRLLNAREDEDFEADNVFEQDCGTPLMAIWFGCKSSNGEVIYNWSKFYQTWTIVAKFCGICVLHMLGCLI